MGSAPTSCKDTVRARLHQVSASMLRQLCYDASDSVLIDNNGVTCNGLQCHSGAAPLFLMKTVLLASLQSCHSIDADVWCKWALTGCVYICKRIYLYHRCG